MQIKFKENTKDCRASVIYCNNEDTIIHFKLLGACHGMPLFDSQGVTKAYLIFPIANVNVSEEDFIEWLKFCEKCGFKNTLSKDDEKLGNDYSKIEEPYYKVCLDYSNYPNKLMIFAAFTVIRMISYGLSGSGYQENGRKIIETICELLEAKPNLSPLDALIISHCVSKESGHFILSDMYNTFSKLNVDSMHDSSSKYTSLNSLFSNECPVKISEIKKQVLEKDYKNIVW